MMLYYSCIRNYNGNVEDKFEKVDSYIKDKCINIMKCQNLCGRRSILFR